MSAALRPGDTPPPERHPQLWQPPERPWQGRFLFFAAGVACWVVGFVVESQLQRRSGFSFSQRGEEAVIAAVPVAVGTWIVVQRIRRGPRWRWASFVCGAVFPPVACIGTLLGGTWLADVVRRRDFDPAVWRSEAGSVEPHARAWMTDDLLDEHPLVGMTKAEAEALLGPSELPGGWTSYAAGWCLGPDRQFIKIDNMWLVVTVGSDGRIDAVSFRGD